MTQQERSKNRPKHHQKQTFSLGFSCKTHSSRDANQSGTVSLDGLRKYSPTAAFDYQKRYGTECRNTISKHYKDLYFETFSVELNNSA